MTTDLHATDLHTLAAAVVQSPHWRWMPGMLAAGPAGPKGGRKRARVESRFADDITPKCVDFNGRRVPASYACMCEANEVVPDLFDPATLGCLLALVREAFNDDTIHLSPATYDRHDTAEPEIRWHVNRHHEGEDEWMRESGAFGAMVDGHRDPPIVGASAVVALVAALLAAPPQ